MSVFIDELTIVVPGNVVKKSINGGRDSSLRISRDQLDGLEAAVAEARAIFGSTGPTPEEEPSTGGSKVVAVDAKATTAAS